MSTANLKTEKTGEIGKTGIATIYGPGTLFMRNHIGEAQGDGTKYELSTSMNGAPMIRSEKTGKYFVFSWNELLGYAIENGIDL